jgi:signal transduction histidine kinase
VGIAAGLNAAAAGPGRPRGGAGGPRYRGVWTRAELLEPPVESSQPQPLLPQSVQRWLQASAEVTRRLLSGADPEDVLDLVTRQVLEIVALELAGARRDAEQVTVLQDRERIARDLHDLVIQRLYATGMSLQGAMPLIGRPEAADRVSQAVDALDDTIGDIRSAIFALQARGVGPAAVREQILQVVDEMTGPLGFAPSLSLAGDLGDHVPEDIAAHMLGALRESLSNAARHAEAGRVDVSIEAGRDLVLVVRDDGIGMGNVTRRSGLANLAERAGELGGALKISPSAGGGTELHWQVPLRASS